MKGKYLKSEKAPLKQNETYNNNSVPKYRDDF